MRTVANRNRFFTSEYPIVLSFRRRWKEDDMPHPPGSPSPRMSFWLVAAMLGMISVPTYFTLHTVRVSASPIALSPNPSPYGYTVSLLLFIVPIVVIAFWFVPREGVKISRKAFWWTIGILFSLG